ncbi:MAG: MotA/TolQ/ExbB proton channel family protein [Candidatus Latescibacteria bacterium]|nr:MotA/TolQ/ExbB proton channel family protein [Candidatus Latescibacterota bacterium]
MSDSVLTLIAESGPVGKGVMLLLLGFSVASWAIMGQKYADFKRIGEESAAFLKLFHSGAAAAELYRQAKTMKGTPVCGLFIASYDLMYRGRGWGGTREDLWKAVGGVAGDLLGQTEKNLAFLATVGNVSPFVGLFGTVWGIMDSFRSIGLQRSANLAVVAPGIAEALIATAAGLVAAIPAVIAYNHFLGRVEATRREMERFAGEMMGMLQGESRT